jgi:hypothetical protein
MSGTQFCSGSYLADRAADGKDYPDTGPLPFSRVGERDEGCDDNGEPLCAEPQSVTHASQPHHINTEN